MNRIVTIIVAGLCAFATYKVGYNQGVADTKKNTPVFRMTQPSGAWMRSAQSRLNEPPRKSTTTANK